MKKFISTMKNKLKEAKGFTLVEMIVVMAIIGILVALLAPNVATLIKDAQDTSYDAKCKNVMTTLQAYNAKQAKDGYGFDATKCNVKSDSGVTSNDVAVLEFTSATGNFNTQVQALWKDGTGTTTNVYAGKASGYMPAKILNGGEKMYAFITKDGGVLGVIYVDGAGTIKSAVTNLTIDDCQTTGGTSGAPIDNANFRGKTAAYASGVITFS